MKFKIGTRFIGDDESTFVMTDVGVNHNRSFDIAKELIDVAADAKADTVKFQTYTTKTLFFRKTRNF